MRHLLLPRLPLHLPPNLLLSSQHQRLWRHLPLLQRRPVMPPVTRRLQRGN